jgi:hypothetical protein
MFWQQGDTIEHEPTLLITRPVQVVSRYEIGKPGVTGDANTGPDRAKAGRNKSRWWTLHANDCRHIVSVPSTLTLSGRDRFTVCTLSSLSLSLSLALRSSRKDRTYGMTGGR